MRPLSILMSVPIFALAAAGTLPPAQSAVTTAAPAVATEPADPTPAPATALPDGRALFVASAAACGYEKLRGLKNMVVTIDMSIPKQGLSAPMQLSGAPPNLVRVHSEFPGIGVIEEGFDGTTAWSVDPIQGPAIKTGDVASEAAFTADFFADLDPDRYTSAETVSQVDFSGRRAWKVVATPKVGRERTIYYEVSTGFTIGYEQTQKSPIGDVPSVTEHFDFKEFGGMMFPTRMQSTA